MASNRFDHDVEKENGYDKNIPCLFRMWGGNIRLLLQIDLNKTSITQWDRNILRVVKIPQKVDENEAEITNQMLDLIAGNPRQCTVSYFACWDSLLSLISVQKRMRIYPNGVSTIPPSVIAAFRAMPCNTCHGIASMSRTSLAVSEHTSWSARRLKFSLTYGKKKETNLSCSKIAYLPWRVTRALSRRPRLHPLSQNASRMCWLHLEVPAPLSQSLHSLR